VSANGRTRTGRLRRIVTGGVAAIALCLTCAAPALARQAWRIDAFSSTTVAPGSTMEYFVQTTNVGDANMDGTRIDVRVDLPAGIAAAAAELRDITTFNLYSCFDARDGVSPVAGARSIICSNLEPVPFTSSRASGFQKLRLTATVDPSASGTLRADFTVSGGGATAARTTDPVIVSTAPPQFGIDAFDGVFASDAAGTPMTQAGGHPYAATVSLDFNAFTSPDPLSGAATAVEPVKDVFVDLPPGLVGDPTVADTCTLGQLAGSGRGFSVLSDCPPTSQIGTTLARIRASPLGTVAWGPFPIFSMVPPPNVPARFGFNILGSIVVLDAELRSDGDYGLSVNVRNIPQAIGIAGTTVTFWGVPASPAHDLERACPGVPAPYDGGGFCRSGAPLKRFLRMPTSCTDPGAGLPVTTQADSWTNPGVFRAATWTTHLPPAYPLPASEHGAAVGVTGCDRVPFSPSLAVRPASRHAGKPAGFQFDLSMPQTDDPAQIGHADLRTAAVTLPLGVRVSPSSADGLGACDPAQIRLDDGTVPTCPESSKVGSVLVDTPLLDEPLSGAVYLARQRDNPFGSLLSIYLVAEGPGLVVKLAGRVDADPLGGQLTTTFEDNPQLPFSNLHLAFKDGPRAPLVLPKQCGTYTTTATMTSWSGRIVVSESSFVVDQGCGLQFTPDFEAGTTNPAAGRSATFTLRLARDDADEELSKLSVDMPGGLTGRIADVPLCAEAAAAAGVCPEASKIGDVTVGAGAGTNPFFITNGRAYLTGPYRGAPFGLSVVVPAVAGPFDLGNVTVRQALFVDKHTAEITVVSDPFPTILEGIPLDVRDVRVAVNRPGFFLNPTSCAEKTITGTVESTAGSRAAVSTRFQVGECAALLLSPELTLRVGGRGRTQRGRQTPLTATLSQTPGESALRRVRVTLPTAINARLTVINDACTRAEYEAGNCEAARTGTATAVTPLLRDPLSGGVYFVRNGNPLPDLFVRLRGQVDFDLIGRITIPGSKRLRTTFDLVPDVPVSTFTLRLDGGREGSIGNAANLCSRRGRRARATLLFEGQNGKRLQVRQRLKIRGCRARSAGSRGRGGRR
jgi:hypothetical protein